MGYGEFGGGGSVHWKVRHGGASGGASAGAGRDGLDGGPGGLFVVYVNGVQVASTAVAAGRVVVVWGDDALGSSEAEPTVNRKIRENPH